MHANAVEQAEQYVQETASALILQSKLLAYQRNDDVVLRNHVEDAWEIVTSERKRTWSREVYIIIGSALFGTFLQGFSTGVSRQRAPDGLWVSVYTLMGFIGILVVFFGLRR